MTDTGLPTGALAALIRQCTLLGVSINKWFGDSPALEMADSMGYHSPSYEWSATIDAYSLYTIIEKLPTGEWYVVEFQITGD